MEKNQNNPCKIGFWNWLKKWWFLHVIVLGFMAYVLNWGHWVTVSIYAKDTSAAVVQEVVKTLARDVEEIKKDAKDQENKRKTDRDKMYELLLDIKREVKKK